MRWAFILPMEPQLIKKLPTREKEQMFPLSFKKRGGTKIMRVPLMI